MFWQHSCCELLFWIQIQSEFLFVFLYNVHLDGSHNAKHTFVFKIFIFEFKSSLTYTQTKLNLIGL